MEAEHFCAGGEGWSVGRPGRREQPELRAEAAGLAGEGWLCVAHLSLQAGARVWIPVLVPRGPSDEGLRAHSESPVKQLGQGPREGVSGGDLEGAFTFGGSPSHCWGDAALPVLPLDQVHPLPSRRPWVSLWTPSAGHKCVRTCGQRGSVPQNLRLTLTMTLMAGMAGCLGRRVLLALGRSRQPPGPLLVLHWPVAGLRVLSIVRRPLGWGLGGWTSVGPAEMSRACQRLLHVNFVEHAPARVCLG